MFDLWVGKIPWRRERLLTPGLWPGEFHGLYSPWCRKESDMTESLSLHIRDLIMIKMMFYNQSTGYIRDSPYFIKKFYEKKVLWYILLQSPLPKFYLLIIHLFLKFGSLHIGSSYVKSGYI